MIFIRIEHDPDALEESPDSFGLPLFPRATAYSLGVFCLSRLNYSRAPLSPGSRAWKWKRTSGVLQPGPALLRAHPTWCFFAQHLHVHAHLPRRPGLWLPPAAPSLPHRRALRRIRTQRAGSGRQHEDGGTTEKSIPFFFLLFLCVICSYYWLKLICFSQDTGLSESMEIDHNSSAHFDEVNND